MPGLRLMLTFGYLCQNKLPRLLTPPKRLLRCPTWDSALQGQTKARAHTQPLYNLMREGEL